MGNEDHRKKIYDMKKIGKDVDLLLDVWIYVPQLLTFLMWYIFLVLHFFWDGCESKIAMHSDIGSFLM